MDPKPPRLTHLFTLRCHFSNNTLCAGWSDPHGPSLEITALNSGFLRGEPDTRAARLDATILGGGSDWMRVDEKTNMAVLDVRIQGRLSDGHGIYVAYTGYLALDHSARQYLSWSPDATSTSYGDGFWWTRPVMETNAPEFKWVERTMFLGQGRWFRDGDVRAVEYRIFEVQTSESRAGTHRQ